MIVTTGEHCLLCYPFSVLCCCYYLATKPCSTLCDPMDCSPPGSSVHRISHARMLGWLDFPFPGDLSDPGIRPTFSALASRFFITEPHGTLSLSSIYSQFC